MKTVSRTLQILALSACFAAQAHGTFAMPGVRQAMRTIESASSQSGLAAALYTVSLAVKPALS